MDSLNDDKGIDLDELRDLWGDDSLFSRVLRAGEVASNPSLKERIKKLQWAHHTPKKRLLLRPVHVAASLAIFLCALMLSKNYLLRNEEISKATLLDSERVIEQYLIGAENELDLGDKEDASFESALYEVLSEIS